MAKISDLIIKLIVDSKGAEEGIDKAETRLQKLAREANEVSKSTAKSVSEVATEVKSSQELMAEGYRSAANSMKDAGSTMNKFITLPLIGLGTGAVIAAKEFESAFAGVRKTVDASEEEFDRLNTSIKQMSMELPFSAAGIAEVTEAAGQLGIETPYIMDFTRVMVDLGVATNLTADQAATSLARFVNIMGTSHTEYSNMGSAIVELGNNFATTESEIVNMSMRLAGAGKQVGMSEAEIFGLSAALTSMGLTAEAGGTAMTKWMTAMQVAGTEGSKKMRELQEATGLTARELELMQSNDGKQFKELAASLDMTTQEMGRTVKAGRDLEKMADVMGLSVEDAAKIMEEDAAGALALFFDGLAAGNAEGTTTIEILNEMGINEVRLRDALLKSGSAHELINEALAMGNKAYRENTALTKEAAERYETLDSRLEMLKNTINVVFINLGEQMIPLIKEFTEWLQGVGEKIANMDPKTFQTIVKLLVKVAAIGPALNISGKAIGLMATNFERIAKKSAALQTLFKAEMFKRKGVTIPDSYIDGGWDPAKAFDMAVQSTNGKTMYTSMGTANKEYVKMLERMTDAQKKEIQTRYESISTLDRYKIKLGATGGQLKEFGQTTQAAGLYTGSLIAYLVHAIATNEDARRGFSELIKTIGGLIKSILSLLGPIGQAITGIGEWTKANLGFSVGVTDLGVVLAGLFMAITNSNPIFLAISAGVVAATKLLEVFGGHIRKNEEYVALNNERMTDMVEVLGNVETETQKIANEALPKITDGFQKLNEITKHEGFSMDAEKLAESTELLTGYLETTEEQVTAHHESRLTAVQTFFERRGGLESEDAKRALEYLDKNNKEYTEEAEFHREKILEIQERLSSGKSVAYEQDEKELEEHLDKLHQLTLRQFDRELKEQNVQTHRLLLLGQEYYNEHGEMDEATKKSLEETLEKHLNTIYEKQFTAEAEMLDLYQEMRDKGEITEEEYREKVEGIALESQLTMLEQMESYTIDYIGMLTGLSDEEVKKYKDLNDEKEKLMEEMETTTSIYDKKQIAEKIKSIDKQLKEDEKLKKAQKAHMDIIAEMPDDYKKYFTDANKNITLDEGIKTIIKNKTRIKELGYEVSAGMATGILSGEKLVIDAIDTVASGVPARAREVWQVKSPSRVMKEIGGFLSEGVAVGILDNVDMVDDATTEMANTVSNADFDVPALSSEFKTRHIRENVVEQSYTMATQVGNAVVDALGKAKIRAYVGEEDFEEGVSDVIYKGMR